jgi:hypothetical protein
MSSTGDRMQTFRRIALAVRLVFVPLLLGFWATSWGAMYAGGHVSKYLAPDGRLKGRLEVRDAQEGFVGVSGEIWVIEPSGRWYAARFVNGHVSEPSRTGDLTQAELSRLAEELARQKFSTLPTLFGRNVSINRHLMTIAFADRQTTLVLRPGETVAEMAQTADDPGAITRFLALVQTIQSLLEKGAVK